jgi:hypothetical protein
MSYYWLYNKRNMTGVTSGAETAYPVCLTVVNESTQLTNVTIFWGLFSINDERVRSTVGLNPGCIEPNMFRAKLSS